jgi:SAM-dependent methyltransferase
MKKLIDKDSYDNIIKLFNSSSNKTEFELIFKNISGNLFSQEKYIYLLKYLKLTSVHHKRISEGPTDILDIIYKPLGKSDDVYRISIYDNININKYLKKLDLWKNHVIFSSLAKLINDTKDDKVFILRKNKSNKNQIDLENFDLRVRLSDEENLSASDLNSILNLSHEHIQNITYRLKQRYTQYVLKTSDEFIKIDITQTKTTNNYKMLNSTVPEYELEIEYGIYKNDVKPDKKHFDMILNECAILFKIIQQSNFIITKNISNLVLTHYKNLCNIDEAATFLDTRQSVSLQIQNLEQIPDKYAITDKADGDRYFMIIMNKHVYFINTNLIVKDSGIELKTNKYDNTIFDGEYIFIPKLNRHLYLIFDCLFVSSVDIRSETKFIKRMELANQVINDIFIFTKQTGFKKDTYKPKNNTFDLNHITDFHSTQIENFIKSLNHDIDYEKQFPLIRSKYFIDVTGAKKWEIFKYAEMLYEKYTNNPNVKCPYLLDGLIFQPLEQKYITNVEDSKLPEFKWKSPKQNSIDFYIEYEKDKNTGKILTVYDNSNDSFVRNKPYRICKLYVGKRIGGKEQPVLFKEEETLYYAYMFLQDGEVRDLDGNILMDKSVAEFYYNTIEGEDQALPDRFRWVLIRSRYDKTDSVRRFGKKYGNAHFIADKIWDSITKPILLSDFKDLAKGNIPEKNQFFYDNKLKLLQEKLGTQISKVIKSVYHQKITNLAKPFRNFHNWIKSNILYTYCNQIYQNNRQLSVFDIGCGRGQDILKYYYSAVSFYVGIDIAKEEITSPGNGAIARYERDRRGKPNFPKMHFINADAGTKLNYDDQNRVLGGMDNSNKLLIEKFFDRSKSGQKTYFDVINCQFAIHYLLKNKDSWENLKYNLSYLRNGGYFIITHFDMKKIVELIGNKDRYTQEFTDKGKSEKLFEIVKKYDNINLKDFKNPVGLGQPIDVYAAWLFEEGTYETEYLVDYEFLKEELSRDCGLELIDTDLFENIYNINKLNLTDTYKYEANQETKKFLTNVAEFYQSSEINDGCKVFSFLSRYCIFRKRDDYKQDGGLRSKDVRGKNININLNESNKYYVPKMDNYENEFSYLNSVHHVLKTHNIIPKSETVDGLFGNLVEDVDIDKNINKINKKLVIENEIKRETSGYVKKKVVDGLNIYELEKDDDNVFKVKKAVESLNKNSKSIILIKEGTLYKPLYLIVDDKKQGLFKNSDENLITMFA